MWPVCTKENCGMHESRRERVFLQNTHNVQNTEQLEESYSRKTNVCMAGGAVLWGKDQSVCERCDATGEGLRRG